MIEFDPTKAVSNFKKHGLSFVDAEPVFQDDRAFTSHRFMGPEKDPVNGESLRCRRSCEAKQYDHSVHDEPPLPACRGCELRHLTTGMDANGILVTVVWTKRNGNERLISMRKARKSEKGKYYEA